MERRTFLKIGGGAMLAPVVGNAIASYCDVRVGRYLNQFITTRDSHVENILNTESSIYTRRSRVGGNPLQFNERRGVPACAGTTAVA